MCVSPKDDGFSEWFHHSLHHGTIDLLGWVFICWGDVPCVVGCPAAPLALLPSMDDGVTHPPTLSLWQPIVSWCCQMSPGCHSCPWLRPTVIDEQEYHIFSHFGIQTGYESPKPFHEGLWSKSYPEFANFSSVQSLSRVWLFATPWTAARQASLSITNSRSPPKPMSIVSVMPSNHLILCRPLLLLPSIFPSIRVFFNESALHLRWPKYWSFRNVHNWLYMTT